MTEQQSVVAALGAAGVLAGVRWAYLSATARSLQTFSEADGLDSAWLGSTRFTYFRDRLDRVFACERYSVPSGDADADLDLLYAELSERDVDTMPRLDPALVGRSDMFGSPGWMYGEFRFLLASCEFGKVDQLPWPRRSATKRRVARQHNPEPSQPSLFDEFAKDEVGGLAALAESDEPDLHTFVVAHSLDRHSRRVELVLGRPRLNVGGGQAWHWRQDILEVPALDGARRAAGFPFAVGLESVPDAPVYLRRPAQDRRAGGAG